MELYLVLPSDEIHIVCQHDLLATTLTEIADTIN